MQANNSTVFTFQQGQLGELCCAFHWANLH